MVQENHWKKLNTILFQYAISLYFSWILLDHPVYITLKQNNNFSLYWERRTSKPKKITKQPLGQFFLNLKATMSPKYTLVCFLTLIIVEAQDLRTLGPQDLHQPNPISKVNISKINVQNIFLKYDPFSKIGQVKKFPQKKINLCLIHTLPPIPLVRVHFRLFIIQLLKWLHIKLT